MTDDAPSPKLVDELNAAIAAADRAIAIAGGGQGALVLILAMMAAKGSVDHFEAARLLVAAGAQTPGYFGLPPEDGHAALRLATEAAAAADDRRRLPKPTHTPRHTRPQ